MDGNPARIDGRHAETDVDPDRSDCDHAVMCSSPAAIDAHPDPIHRRHEATLADPGDTDWSTGDRADDHDRG